MITPLVRALRLWPARRWVVAMVSAAVFVLIIAIPTDLIDTPVFGREIPPTAWAWPSLLVSSVLAGLLLATYVDPAPREDEPALRRGGWLGAALTFLAVGCPTCNKLALVALGSAGALQWFGPVQPLLQALAIGLLVWALRKRLLGELSCPTTPSRGGVARVRAS